MPYQPGREEKPIFNLGPQFRGVWLLQMNDKMRDLLGRILGEVCENAAQDNVYVEEQLIALMHNLTKARGGHRAGGTAYVRPPQQDEGDFEDDEPEDVVDDDPRPVRAVPARVE